MNPRGNDTRAPCCAGRTGAGPVAVVVVVLSATLFLLWPASGLSGATPAATRSSTFHDEFNGPAGSPPDAAKWTYDIGATGWGNNELQQYTSSTSNAALDGSGHLRITALRDARGGYTSARVHTRVDAAQTYGHFEARMLLPAGQGLWPAFWLLGRDCSRGVSWPRCGELDAMENLGRNPSTIETHAHGPGLNFGSPHPLSAPGTRWHVYALDWTARHLMWSIDGKAVQTLTKHAAGAGWVFDRPFFVILDLAVGGKLPGDPDASTVFPASVLVDYVSVSCGSGPSRCRASKSTGQGTDAFPPH